MALLDKVTHDNGEQIKQKAVHLIVLVKGLKLREQVVKKWVFKSLGIMITASFSHALAAAGSIGRWARGSSRPVTNVEKRQGIVVTVYGRLLLFQLLSSHIHGVRGQKEP